MADVVVATDYSLSLSMWDNSLPLSTTNVLGFDQLGIGCGREFSLLASVFVEDITKAIYQIEGLKVPGLDGIHALFFHPFWNQINTSIYV